MSSTLRCLWVLFAMMTLLTAAAAAEPVERELHIVVEVDGQQSWQGTGQFAGEHTLATTSQTYEVTVTLRSDGGLYALNLLDPDRKKRLKAKTIHLARKALRTAQGAGASLPVTPAQRRELTQRMRQERNACNVNSACRHEVSLRYAAIFAAMQYPQALKGDAGPGRYGYFEPYPGCASHWRVDMSLTIEGVRNDHPYREQHSAHDQASDDGGVPLCQRYLAVIDTQDSEQPLYLENFFVPSATGETVILRGDAEPQHSTETQPMPSAVLSWVTAQLKHAPASGTITGSVPLILQLNGISTRLGKLQGQAQVKLTWRFLPAGSSAPSS
ncbi:MAG: hypothetical protein L0H19_05750 [Salinisphaera sp.]|nr:hypothetical protein [Salinisphaera sp.]MDN5938322.1 hypothetical protein [Salinisphaera sp.]